MPKIDATLNGLDADVGEYARRAEELGFDGLWSPELDYDPFLPLPIAADRTEDIEFGTRIATAFTRSPMMLAYVGWNLARFSGGRFRLGLGTQVQAHNERRFSVEWADPNQQLREVVESIRHIWDYWQGAVEEFGYDGEYYSFSLMTTVFNPGPIEHLGSEGPGGASASNIPIYLAAVNEKNVRLAGELADGLCLHSFNTPTYTEERILPWLEDSAEEHGRSLDDVTISASPFVITGEDAATMDARREMVRMRIAFYGSTPAYKPVMATHGWADTGRELWELSREGKWGEMTELVTDEMVAEFAVEAPLDGIADAVRREYDGVADRVLIDVEGGFEDQDYWQAIVEDWHAG
jgi:probable F420-dependent oxidoreductase